MIEVKEITKKYTLAQRSRGVSGAFLSLFHREYVSVTALDSVSFSIGRGELVGYVGPNGAGKSTTIKILSGILVPDSGECRINGLIPWKDRMRHVRRLGVVFGQRTQLWWDLPVIDSFELLRDVYSLTYSFYRDSLDRLVTLLDISNILDTPVRSLSLGQRMRCDLAASLLHGPDILFLDEPTIGLDALAKFAVRDFIREINKTRNVTVILTTHDMDDIEALARRIMIIGEGRLAFDGTMKTLRDSVPAHRHLVMDFHSQNDADSFCSELSNLHGADIIDTASGRVRLAFDPQKLKPETLVREIAENHSFADISIEQPPVEELIARLYRERWGK